MSSSRLLPDNPPTSKRKRSGHKRSLAKRPVDHSPAEGLAIDISKSEMDTIFSGLAAGTIDNPTEALGRIYNLVIASVADTIQSSAVELCENLSDPKKLEALKEDNPLAPWLLSLLPKTTANIAKFRTALSASIHSASQSIQDKLAQAIEQNAQSSENMQFSEHSELIRNVLSHSLDSTAQPGIPFLTQRISDDRLREILSDIQNPSAAPKTKQTPFRVDQTPNLYRISFGTGRPRSAKTSAEAAPMTINAAETLSISPPPPSDPEQSVSPDSAHTASPALTPPEQTPSTITPDSVSAAVMTSPEYAAIKDAGLNIAAAANEITQVMNEIALQIADEIIHSNALQNDHWPSLHDILSTDTRIAEDSELEEFIKTLDNECEDTEYNSSVPNNDELAEAFSKLLDEFEEQ